MTENFETIKAALIAAIEKELNQSLAFAANPCLPLEGLWDAIDAQMLRQMISRVKSATEADKYKLEEALIDLSQKDVDLDRQSRPIDSAAFTLLGSDTVDSLDFMRSFAERTAHCYEGDFENPLSHKKGLKAAEAAYLQAFTSDEDEE